MELVAENAVERFQELVSQIQGQFGTDTIRNAVHCSADNPTAAREIATFFNQCGPEP
jgi:nucleoside diphosphate kinase